ncbi:MAG: ABC transporter ATP-binding protein [Promethearchaeota archaeon]
MEKVNSYAIEVQNICKHFKEVKAVDDISLKINKGELFSILGPNGAGKTTLINMLTTVLTPTSGDAQLNGFSIRTDKNEIVKDIGVCPQEIVIYNVLTAEENVEFVARMHGLSKIEAKKKARKLLEQFGISGRKDRAKTFSGGMKRRLNLVMALVFDPKILFLDEPTAGLDPQARRLVWDFIGDLKSKDITIILTTHDMNEAEMLSDRIAIIDMGKIIAQGTPSELKEKYGTESVLEISFLDKNDVETVNRSVEHLPFVSNKKEMSDKKNKLHISFEGGLKNLIKILQQGIVEKIGEVDNIKFRQTTLEDVFLNLTGRRLRD